jgi:hypothetical protein
MVLQWGRFCAPADAAVHRFRQVPLIGASADRLSGIRTCPNAAQRSLFAEIIGSMNVGISLCSHSSW